MVHARFMVEDSQEPGDRQDSGDKKNDRQDTGADTFMMQARFMVEACYARPVTAPRMVATAGVEATGVATTGVATMGVATAGFVPAPGVATAPRRTGAVAVGTRVGETHTLPAARFITEAPSQNARAPGHPLAFPVVHPDGLGTPIWRSGDSDPAGGGRLHGGAWASVDGSVSARGGALGAQVVGGYGGYARWSGGGAEAVGQRPLPEAAGFMDEGTRFGVAMGYGGRGGGVLGSRGGLDAGVALRAEMQTPPTLLPWSDPQSSARSPATVGGYAVAGRAAVAWSSQAHPGDRQESGGRQDAAVSRSNAVWGRAAGPGRTGVPLPCRSELSPPDRSSQVAVLSGLAPPPDRRGLLPPYRNALSPPYRREEDAAEASARAHTEGRAGYDAGRTAVSPPFRRDISPPGRREHEAAEALLFAMSRTDLSVQHGKVGAHGRGGAHRGGGAHGERGAHGRGGANRRGGAQRGGRGGKVGAQIGGKVGDGVKRGRGPGRKWGKRAGVDLAGGRGAAENAPHHQPSEVAHPLPPKDV